MMIQTKILILRRKRHLLPNLIFSETSVSLTDSSIISQGPLSTSHYDFLPFITGYGRQHLFVSSLTHFPSDLSIFIMNLRFTNKRTLKYTYPNLPFPTLVLSPTIRINTSVIKSVDFLPTMCCLQCGLRWLQTRFFSPSLRKKKEKTYVCVHVFYFFVSTSCETVCDTSGLNK